MIVTQKENATWRNGERGLWVVNNNNKNSGVVDGIPDGGHQGPYEPVEQTIKAPSNIGDG
jgi:hypothetical protein